jgi:hypothetical protein
MLERQNLGRSHDNDLISGIHHIQGGDSGNDRFPASDIAV